MQGWVQAVHVKAQVLLASLGFLCGHGSKSCQEDGAFSVSDDPIFFSLSFDFIKHHEESILPVKINTLQIWTKQEDDQSTWRCVQDAPCVWRPNHGSSNLFGGKSETSESCWVCVLQYTKDSAWGPLLFGQQKTLKFCYSRQMEFMTSQALCSQTHDLCLFHV